MVYSESHIRIKNTVEKAFWVWNRRLPALKLRIKKESLKVRIIPADNLHNLCMLPKEIEPPGYTLLPGENFDEETLGRNSKMYPM